MSCRIKLMDEAKEYLTDFGLVFDEEEPDIVLSIGEMEHYSMHFININTA